MRCKISFSFIGIAFLTLLMIYDKNGNAGLCICAAVFHETGHILMLLLFRDLPQRLCIGIYGMRIERAEKTNVSYLGEALIAVSGPLFNLITAAVTLLFAKGVNDFVGINMVLALFNLLPLTPLDGGRVIYHLLCHFKDDASAKRITKTVTAFGIIPLTVTGILIFIYDKSNFSLLLSAVYISFSLLSFPNS